MNRILQQVANQYWFRVSLTVICCLATICLGVHQSYVWFSVSACLLILRKFITVQKEAGRRIEKIRTITASAATVP